MILLAHKGVSKAGGLPYSSSTSATVSTSDTLRPTSSPTLRPATYSSISSVSMGPRAIQTPRTSLESPAQLQARLNKNFDPSNPRAQPWRHVGQVGGLEDTTRGDGEDPKPAHDRDSLSISASNGNKDWHASESGIYEEAAHSIQTIEKRAKASIQTLRSILYNVKTRPKENLSGSVGLLGGHAGNNVSSSEAIPSVKVRKEIPEAVETELPQQRDKLQEHSMVNRSTLREVSNSLRSNLQKDFDLRADECPYDDVVQHDAVISTRTKVKFNRESNTVVIILTATVRGCFEKGNQQETAQGDQTSIILAARALRRACAVLEKKATGVSPSLRQTSLESTHKGSLKEYLVNGEKVVARKSNLREHEGILSQLREGKVTDSIEIRNSYGATAHRPVYVLKLARGNKILSHAIFKPFVSGDAHCRWSRASPEWVAYNVDVGLFLGTDTVPPAVMREWIQVGDKKYSLGTLLHFVPDVKPLTRLGPQEWGAESAAYCLSNVHILDALVGNAPRTRQLFMEGLHWSAQGQRRPMLLDHPMGAAPGKLHCMWSLSGKVKGVKRVSPQTLQNLKALNLEMLKEALGSHLTDDELRSILVRRDGLVSYFKALGRFSTHDRTSTSLY